MSCAEAAYPRAMSCQSFEMKDVLCFAMLGDCPGPSTYDLLIRTVTPLSLAVWRNELDVTRTLVLMASWQ